MDKLLTKKEQILFRRLNTPTKIQNYLNSIHFNFEESGETCLSPRGTIEVRKAHCLEGALLASAVLWYHGHKPLLLDLRAAKHDLDHVVAVFEKNGYLGAISKTNHAVLRYREPIYKTLRELALSYFHEYFTNKGDKTLKSYSRLFDLRKLGTKWITESEVWYISEALDKTQHFPIVPKNLKLRRADKVEIRAGEIVEYKK